MAKAIVLDEFHLTVLLPAGISKIEIAPVQRTLNNRKFQARLRQTIGGIFRKYRSLRPVKLRLSR